MQRALSELPENFSILEEQIEIDLQMKYFDFAKEIRIRNISNEYFKDRNDLFLDVSSEERKKEILTAIASIDDVKAFRTIEKFVEETEGDLKKWAILALQESRMLIQSSLLDEQQVFISTGLGGKGKKLRYYVVFINKDENELLNATQQKLLKNEIIFELKDFEGEFESLDFMEGFSTSLVMLPLQTDIKNVFRNIIDECNQYGNFLKEDMIITNVKILSRGEIIKFLNEGNGLKNSGIGQRE
jgi:hypothetical protein